MLNKIKKIKSLFSNRESYINAKTYYNEEIRKSKFEIFCNQIYFIFKYGDMEPFYFTYGFDRKSMTLDKICSNYIIPYYSFQRKINKLNTINPIYGKFSGRVITADKFYFNIFLNKFSIPTPNIFLYIKDKEILYVNNKFIEDLELIEKEERLKFIFSRDMDAFAKPSDGQLGNGIFSLLIKDKKIYVDNKPLELHDLIKIVTSADYLIQERIVQHPLMASLCSSTLNSIRLQTVRDNNGNIIPFGAGLRIGREGNNVDNWAKGGVFVGINMNNGKLNKTGFLKPKFGTSLTKHPDTNIIFENFEIPFFKKAISLACELHKKMYRCHSVGWDIAISNDGPIFIEGNGLWEISLVQAANGGMKHFEKYFQI